MWLGQEEECKKKKKEQKQKSENICPLVVVKLF